MSDYMSNAMQKALKTNKYKYLYYHFNKTSIVVILSMRFQRMAQEFKILCC